jgi:hypothetical protein
MSRSQKARSFELRAALSLSKLYRACRRDGDAHAALGSALDGFAPTPEFPEIEEALALLAATGSLRAFMTQPPPFLRTVNLEDRGVPPEGRAEISPCSLERPLSALGLNCGSRMIVVETFGRAGPSSSRIRIDTS